MKLYHGTSKHNYENMLRVGFINELSWFARSPTTAMIFAYFHPGDVVVLEVEVGKEDLVDDGYLSLMDKKILNEFYPKLDAYTAQSLKQIPMSRIKAVAEYKESDVEMHTRSLPSGE